VQVAWVRVDTQTILTIHNNVISRNPRLSLSRPAEKKWDLHIDRYSVVEDLKLTGRERTCTLTGEVRPPH
jgi:hypothetical protein